MKTMLMVMLAAVSALAQDSLGQINRKTVIIDGQPTGALRNTIEFVSGGLVFSGQIVKGAPFSAEAVTETTQMLADGNRIVQRTSSKQYRDSQGRERREENSSMGATFISDPVAQVSYTLHPESRTVEKNPLFGPAVISQVYLGENKTFFFRNFEQFRENPLPAPPVAPGANVKEEQLGTNQIEGVPAQGTRTTTTIPAGQIGNDRPINVVYERWFSPDLQLTVMTKLSDPRSGETVYKLTNILRVEQVHSLFEIPSDYTVATTGVTFTKGRTF